MTTGQLRVRINAYEREKTWAPAYVADQLAATRQTADARRNDGTLLNVQADTAADPDQRDELLEQAGDDAALAMTLDAQAADLMVADEARGQWYAHTAETRAAAERAAIELSTRDDATPDEPAVTAEEWLAARRASDQDEDPHRQVVDEYELTDSEDERNTDLATVNREPAADEPVAAPAPDIRTIAVAEPTPEKDTSMRVPSAEETAAAVRRAQEARVELRQRRSAEAQHEADEQAERDADLARWHEQQHTDTGAREQATDDGSKAADQREPALELSPIHN